MPHIAPLSHDAALGATAQTLDAVKSKLGMVPNLIATLAHAPAALNAYLALSETLAAGRLTARQREIVALAVAQENACRYCLSAHTMLGRKAGLNDEEIFRARAGSAREAADAAIARFAQHVVKMRGRLSPGDLEGLRRDGLEDALAIEVIAHVTLNLLTNYTNHIAGTKVDFPPVED